MIYIQSVCLIPTHNYWNRLSMTNNFNASLSFNKRQIDFTKVAVRQNINRNAMNSPEETDNKIHYPFERGVNKSDKVSAKLYPPNTDLSAEISLSSSQRLRLRQKQTTLPNDNPIRHPTNSPPSVNISTSPPAKETNSKYLENLSIRATLKNVALNKSPPTDSNITKQDNPSPTVREYTQPKSIEDQNERLRQQNAYLRNELNDLKRKLLFGPNSKKQELLCSLRDTVKKSNNEISQLKVKLDILGKKNAALQGLMVNKEEELLFMSGKISKIEQQLRETREGSETKLQELQDKVAFVLKSYQQLEIKLVRNEKDDALYRAQWQEEKDMYMDRISFLEGVCRMDD